MEFVGQLKNEDGINADRKQSMYVFYNFRKNQRNEIKTFSRKCNSIIKDGEFMKKREVN